MSDSFTSVARQELQKAFAFAHKLSEDDSVPEAQRIQFRSIARLIWKAHGEPGIPPAGSGAELLGRMTFADSPAHEASPNGRPKP